MSTANYGYSMKYAMKSNNVIFGCSDSTKNDNKVGFFWISLSSNSPVSHVFRQYEEDDVNNVCKGVFLDSQASNGYMFYY